MTDRELQGLAVGQLRREPGIDAAHIDHLGIRA